MPPPRSCRAAAGAALHLGVDVDVLGGDNGGGGGGGRRVAACPPLRKEFLPSCLVAPCGRAGTGVFVGQAAVVARPPHTRAGREGTASP